MILKDILKTWFYLKNKKTIYFIDTEDDVDFLVHSLENKTILGIDTEFDWRTTYFRSYPLFKLQQKIKFS